MFPFSNTRWFQNYSMRWRIFTSEDLVKLYECCYYVSLLDSNFRQTASNDWHNKLYHYDGTFSQLFPIVLVYSLKWYFFSRNEIYLAIKFLSVWYIVSNMAENGHFCNFRLGYLEILSCWENLKNGFVLSRTKSFGVTYPGLWVQKRFHFCRPVSLKSNSIYLYSKYSQI